MSVRVDHLAAIQDEKEEEEAGLQQGQEYQGDIKRKEGIDEDIEDEVSEEGETQHR